MRWSVNQSWTGRGWLVVASLKRWWQQPTYYDWLSGYLHARGMSAPTRAMMASIAGSLGLCLMALLFSSDGPQGTLPVAMTWTAFAGGVLGMILWTTRWPTRLQSVEYAVVTNTSIALACLAHPTPLASLIGCVAFATTGGYIAFFHTSKFVFYNFAVAAGVASFEATRLASSGHPALAGVDLFLVLQVNIALPLAIQVMIRALSHDLAHADRDPLTGLLNRRAFLHKALGLLVARPAPDMHLLVVVIDLDNFKALNDHYGHSAGDAALTQVAQALRSSTGDTAITARSGGEEFIVADTSYGNDPGPLAKRICDAIADISSPVTASVGTACAALHGSRESGYQALIDDLVGAADQAMYHAKRFGGNRFHHYGPVR
jgi:diguanylate cyclase (GGDEF)-like protein